MIDKKMCLNLALIIGVAWLLSFIHLGNLPLLDPDEPVYAQTALEMLQHQDFISPRIYGNFWYDKPPMYYWLVAASFKLFGVSEFAARFPSALLAAAGAILIYLSGRKLFNDRAGLLAALILITSLEYFYLSQAAVTDMTLTFFLSGALLAFLHRKYLLFYSCAALAVVTKGPVGLVFCGSIGLLYLIATRNLQQLKQMKLVRGILVFSALAVPWYAAMIHFHGMDFVNTFLGFHNITRFLQPEHPEGSLWYYYIPVLLIGLFPWTPFLFQSFGAAYKERGQVKNALIFFMLWASLVFLFFTFSQTKLVSYILPMYPPVALLIGWYLDQAWAERRALVLKWGSGILTLLIVCIEAGLYAAANHVTAAVQPLLAKAALIFVLVLLANWGMSYRKDFRGVIVVNVTGMMVFTFFLMTQLLPFMAPSFHSKEIANAFTQNYDRQSPVYVAKFYRPGFAFYSGVPGEEFNPLELQATLAKNPKAYFIVQKKYYENMNPEFKENIRVIAAVEDKILFVRGNP